MIDHNTTKFTEDRGKVTGVKLEIIPLPNQQYFIDTLTLIDENSARGKTVCTFFVEGQNHKCMLGYPLAKDGKFANKLSVGGSNNEHVISNGFNPLIGIGPLSIFVADEKGNCISEIVTGLGLPNNHHVSFVVGYKKAGSISYPTTNNLEDRVLVLETQLKKLQFFICNQWLGD